ncbi:glycosyltransferase [Mesorhizobium sp. CA18]|uniref:CgeB family protein n=1 Tax=unclassified Mesorhizobium TaxID=325217 RepID=UPI001CCE61B0|nr:MULTISPECIES: glycosyltransferase [unclassified Mesorhizobium]MBZ9735940.1 glycosyltransferase [Mesorhizobium sp. CA9]MBZ9826612.1 glycosyltransferase [Mesorhizobium sp. CA18]MBZ9830839.1 glycosyltransferase [Mesorhizobium sp. CA2]MBZ9835485.1 glycosyltransferase [Mesorhizobium sp. CA3]MBZ9875831.1 glycosyltransferase [Mesorhizobium sp. Ca11]
MTKPLDIVFLGLSLSSSWGNGHATTFRGLLRALNELGHRVTFLERDVPWYAHHRDLRDPDFCDLRYYQTVSELPRNHRQELQRADAVVIGSFVPEGRAIIDDLASLCTGQFCFYDIDTPVTLARVAEDDCDYLARRQIPYFDVYFSFTGGPTLQRLRSEFGARRTEPLYCSVDPKRHHRTRDAIEWDLGYLGTYSADRQLALEALLLEPSRRLPERRFVVAGSQYPSDIAWPDNVERIEHLPPAEHAAFYSRQRYTLNLTRASMIAAGWSPSVRLFEAAACGTPIISDRWPGLDSFFPESTIETAASAGDVQEILTAKSERARLDMARSAREAVLASHTGGARAREFVQALTQSVHARAAIDLNVESAA